jgi:precorrin-6A synthase
MRRLYIIGIGVGDPDQVTLQAVRALNEVDVFFAMEKGAAKHDLVQLRKQICERYIERTGYRFVEAEDPIRDARVVSYEARVRAWHDRRAEIYEQLLLTELSEDGCGAFLVWGDPALYDSTLRIVEEVARHGRVGFEYRVIPGISSVQALAASHRLVLNGIGAPLHITTGRKLAEGFPAGVTDVVVMLDGECTFASLRDEELEIYWGAYLGSADELLISGQLRERAEEIQLARAQARARKGWIMDIYLLRRPAARGLTPIMRGE